MNPKSLLKLSIESYINKLSDEQKSELKNNINIPNECRDMIIRKINKIPKIYILLTTKNQIVTIYTDKVKAHSIALAVGLFVHKYRTNKKSSYYYCIKLPNGPIIVSHDKEFKDIKEIKIHYASDFLIITYNIDRFTICNYLVNKDDLETELKYEIC